MKRTRWLVFLLARFAAAQDPWPDVETLVERLRSTDPVVVAWAAHDARGKGAVELAVPLQRALQRWNGELRDAAPRGGEHGDVGARVRLHLLDALLKLGRAMPATEVLPLLDDEVCGVAAFALLLSSPVSNQQELLGEFARAGGTDDERSLRWLACGNLLASAGSPAFAEQLAGGVSAELRVVVVDEVGSERAASRLLPSRGSTATDDERMPPLPSMCLEVPRRWQVPTLMLAPGPIAVAFERSTGRLGWRGSRSWSGAVVETPGFDVLDGLGWLGGMVDMPDAPRRRRELVFDDAATYRAAVTEARAELTRYRRALADALVAKRKLTEAQARPLRAPVRVVVHDAREAPTTALPRLDRER